MRALSRNTRRATAVTLAAALVIAVYLNWQYARSDVPTELPDNAAMVAAEAEDVPVQAQTVLDELPTEAEAVSSANKNYGEAQLVSVASDSGAKFFEQARLKRQKAHDEAMDSIKKTMKSSSLSAEEKKEYTAQMTANLEDLNAENEIETLIKAKGFADCLCFLQSGRADLTVMTSGEPLTAEHHDHRFRRSDTGQPPRRSLYSGGRSRGYFPAGTGSQDRCCHRAGR